MRKTIENYELVQVNKDMVVFEVSENDKKFIAYFKNVNVSDVKNIH